MELEIMSLKFTLVAEDTIKLPQHPGSTFRGAFGHGLREIACNIEETKCKECDLKSSCAYSLLFNPFLVGKEKFRNSKRFKDKPRPFVFKPLTNRKEVFREGEQIEFKLNLFGYLDRFLPYIIKAWKYLENQGIGIGRGKFVLSEVWNLNQVAGKQERVYSKDFGFNQMTEAKITKEDVKQFQNIFTSNSICLKLVTPTLLKYKGEFVDKIEFHTLMRNLFRRLTSLSLFYGEEQLDIDFGSYLDQAEEIELVKDNTSWQSWERYSNRQNKRIKMKGLVGEVEYKGNLEKFLSYLILGQYVNVGKNTVFGLGNYKLIKN
ncbi:hypothetical protein Halha_0961 [Halobacteroides halobius DSM 5150]|uniref:CRISPR-associated protein Cas6 C-terminal domain-containing protein n=1 Tax=Halobacteroides halobius (strain ATCC 35273 / DSM 5150 / MD-1) TaxID=748449 RepID=L0K6N4_HALHC|nr:CRISPR system precrRNA processing endoribonuclease RAMP protein Cas6 [Halobacteroides halobius]AGB40922.1 hypothetical protein Halha_0961 [Halobacteroides halobius DSM 5150]